MIEVNYILTSEYTWTGAFDDLPDELQALVAANLPEGNIDSHDPDDLAEVIFAQITDVDLSKLGTMGAELQSESYEAESVTVD